MASWAKLTSYDLAGQLQSTKFIVPDNPCIARASREVSRKMSNPESSDGHVVIRVLGYLKKSGMAEYMYRRQESPNAIQMYTALTVIGMLPEKVDNWCSHFVWFLSGSPSKSDISRSFKSKGRPYVRTSGCGCAHQDVYSSAFKVTLSRKGSSHMCQAHCYCTADTLCNFLTQGKTFQTFFATSAWQWSYCELRDIAAQWRVEKSSVQLEQPVVRLQIRSQELDLKTTERSTG